MILKYKFSALGIVGVAVFLMVFTMGVGVVYAEDDAVCKGVISGSTVTDAAKWNPNIGITSFDQDLPQNVSVLGGVAYDIAPPREYAACTVDKADELFMTLAADEFSVRGYAWNTNLGFVSMYCNGAGIPYKNENIACGNFKYGVKVGADGSGGGPGIRQLYGYAWNEGFGYINFYCKGNNDGFGNACGPFDYGVTRDAAGNISGFAYTESGVYSVLDGVRVGLPNEVLPEVSWCYGKPYVCLEVTPDPGGLSFEIEPGFDGGYRLADGTDKYEIHIYLREADGVTPMKPSNYKISDLFKTLRFYWTDTVKLNQMAGNKVGDALNEKIAPYKEGLGGITFKPVGKLTEESFSLVEPGHYVLKNSITSFAPTYEGNVSKTTSLNKPTLFNNEKFLFNYTDALNSQIENNFLKLDRLEYVLLNFLGDPVTPGVIYPNGVKGLAFKFRPVFDLDTLYVNDLQDKIVGYRGIPVNFKLQGLQHKSKLPDVKPTVNLRLAYDETKTTSDCGGLNASFDFHFLNDLEGKDLLLCAECDDHKETPPECSICARYDYVNDLMDQPWQVIAEKAFDVQAVATIDATETTPCMTATGPGLFSEISYKVENSIIKYYGNKIPRLAGSLIANPAAVVHGNVYAQSSFNPSSDVESVQTAGSVNIDIVRDTVKENVNKELQGKKIPKGANKTCGLKNLDGVAAESCTGEDFITFDVKQSDERVFYFKNSNVILKTESWVGKKIIIVDGGNVFIDSDLYNADSSANKLTIVALRNFDQSYSQGGNIYIDPIVKNIQANIVADGSIFSYSGNKTTGIYPKGSAFEGEPKWVNNDERIALLGTQLFFEGSISSRNTIGGADLDTPRSGKLNDAKSYLLLGTGKILPTPVTTDQRIRAQLYDLNYLRLFRMEIEITGEGLPVDQSCGKGLDLNDVVAISNGETILYQGITCDGINPLEVAPFGDLVPPPDVDSAKGLDPNNDFDPVYVYYVAPSQSSFVFSKPGALSITN